MTKYKIFAIVVFFCFVSLSAAGSELHESAKNGQDQILKALLDKGYDPNEIDVNGFTPLMLAAKNGQYNTTKLLISAGASVNISNDEGNTALSGAIAKEDASIVKLLIISGADVNYQKTKSDVTPLMLAAAVQNTTIAKILLESGADPGIKTKDGITALLTSMLLGDKEMIKLLTEFKPSTVTKLSSREEKIRIVQKKLSRLSYNPGPVDGKMGEKTKKAIKKFQKDFNLPINGKISDSLIDSLNPLDVVIVTDKSGAEQKRYRCQMGENIFLGEVFVPCGATFIQEPGQIGGKIKH